MSVVRMNVSGILLNRERSNWIFYCGTLATIQESRRSLKLEIIEWVPT